MKLAHQNLKNLGGVKQIVNPGFINHHHIRMKSRSFQSEKYISLKCTQKKRQFWLGVEESNDCYILCKTIKEHF